jgi:DNA-binding transcriptional LysR family regulator
MLDLLKLKTFRLVADTSNFTRAAAELGYSQSNVTAHIKALEKELGAPLFDRYGHGVVLTAVGRRTLEYADRLLKLASETTAIAAQGPEVSGTLKLGLTDFVLTYRLPDVLERFQQSYPQVQLLLQPPSDSAALPYDVMDGTVDVAFLAGEPVKSGELEVDVMAEEELVFVASPKHELALATKDLGIKELATAQILLTERNCPFRSILERNLAQRQIRLHSKLELGNTEAVKRCCGRGMGIAVLPKIVVASELSEGKLVLLRTRALNGRVATQVLRNRGRWISPGVQALRDLVVSPAAPARLD